MKRCVRCRALRHDDSFHNDTRHPVDICKPCIYRPRRGNVEVAGKQFRSDRAKRAQDAILSVVEFTQKAQPFIYLIQNQGLLKIGTSKDIKRRMKQLNTGTPFPYQLIAVAPGGRELEQELHQRFRHWKIRAEWFERRLEVIERFRSLPGSLVFLPGYITAEAPPPSDVSDASSL